MSTRLAFWKYHGLGNDFVVVERAVSSKEARALCDRSFGIGADGVLEVTEAGGHLAGAVKVWNSDGSVAEICGNGMRCVSLHLAQTRDVGPRLVLDSGAGEKSCEIIEHDRAGRAIVEVEMGAPQLDRAAIPVRGEGRMLEEAVTIEGRTLELTGVGMGNPHAVIFGDFTIDEVRSLGPILEHHELFPADVNAGFASMITDDHIDLTVWERGAGLTGACGSGACAAAVAACETDRAQHDAPLTVKQPGGELIITVEAQSRSVTMRGPAKAVFSAEIDLDLLLS